MCVFSALNIFQNICVAFKFKMTLLVHAIREFCIGAKRIYCMALVSKKDACLNVFPLLIRSIVSD